MKKQAAGMRAFFATFDALGADNPAKVRELATAHALPASTLFGVVQRLDDAGLIARTADGRVVMGDKSVRLGFAAFGLGPLHGPAETLLAMLRDRTEASVGLHVPQSGEDALLHYPARWQLNAAKNPGKVLISRLDLPLGCPAVEIRLTPAIGIGPDRLNFNTKQAEAFAFAISTYMNVEQHRNII